MGSAAATAGRIGKRSRSARTRFRSSDEFRQVLDRALAEVDADDRAGPLLHAAGLRLRFRLTDLGQVLDIAASDDRRHHLRWSFAGDGSFEPKLDVSLDSEVLNGYLQGKESLAIATARGRVHWQGEARSALLYLPAARLMVEPYRRVVKRDFPHLALD